MQRNESQKGLTVVPCKAEGHSLQMAASRELLVSALSASQEGAIVGPKANEACRNCWDVSASSVPATVSLLTLEPCKVFINTNWQCKVKSIATFKTPGQNI